jgi:hypothetical protein
MGSASLWLPADVRAEQAQDGGVPDAGPLPAPADDGFVRLDARRAIQLTGAWKTPKALADALGACESATGELTRLGAAMTKTGTENAGDHAARAISLRRRARAACAVALARVVAAGDKPDDRARIDRATNGIFVF